MRALAVMAGLACAAGTVQVVRPFPSPLLAAAGQSAHLQPYDIAAVVGAAPLRIVEPAYSLWAEPTSAVVTLASPSGSVYTSLPLCTLAGRASLPVGAYARTTLENGALHTRLLSRTHVVLSDAVLHPAAQSFTVSFSAPLGSALHDVPAFFSDGGRGIAMATVEDGFSPDVRGPSASAVPAVSSIGRAPFAPPPFDVELRSQPGWFGVGLVQVPDATAMRLGPDGAVTLDYPLAAAGSAPDFGAGPPAGGLVRFPDFVVTFARDPESGLRAYHDALAGLHAVTVASPPGRRPAWWSDPLVDTWGEQMATGAQRGSPVYSADWVRRFVADWRARYHVQHFTVVIDSRWQEHVGEPLPDVVRFGGLSGMRALVDDLHAQGLHVLLWWPMWARAIDHIPLSARQARLATGDHVIDPTGPDFSSDMAETVRTLLGSAAGDLGADGLKLDWQYDIPDTLADPSLAYGARALYRYMDVVHSDAHAVRADVMIDASAAAPQFDAVADTVRLYDAWSPTEWDRRAAIVAAADPDMLIDGDGWQVDAADVVPHAVSSTVYGTPAMYFSTTWVGRSPISAELAGELGSVLGLAPVKGQGRAVAMADGEWQYDVGRSVTAQTFLGERALVVRPPSCTAQWDAQVVSTVAGRVLVPINPSRIVGAYDATHHSAQAVRSSRGVQLNLRAGEVYTLVLRGGC